MIKNNIYLPPHKLFFQTPRVPQKTVIISGKNNTDIIKDTFVGYHVQRPNPLELVKSALESVLNFIIRR